MREAKTALKSASSPLALSSFPKLLVAFAGKPQRLDGLSEGGRDGRWRGRFFTHEAKRLVFRKAEGMGGGEGGTVLLCVQVRETKTALKSGSSPLALSSFPKLPVAFAVSPQRLDGLSEGGRLQRSFFSEAHFPEPCAR